MAVDHGTTAAVWPVGVAEGQGIADCARHENPAEGAIDIAGVERMTYYQAIAILNRVRNGDKTPTLAEITQALQLTGDLEFLA